MLAVAAYFCLLVSEAQAQEADVTCSGNARLDPDTPDFAVGDALMQKTLARQTRTEGVVVPETDSVKEAEGPGGGSGGLGAGLLLPGGPRLVWLVGVLAVEGIVFFCLGMCALAWVWRIWAHVGAGSDLTLPGVTQRRLAKGGHLFPTPRHGPSPRWSARSSDADAGSGRVDRPQTPPRPHSPNDREASEPRDRLELCDDLVQQLFRECRDPGTGLASLRDFCEHSSDMAQFLESLSVKLQEEADMEQASGRSGLCSFNEIQTLCIDIVSSSPSPITKEEVEECQANFSASIRKISKTYLEKGDYVATAAEAAGLLYGYGHTEVLFKPAKASEYPFRPTPEEAMSYFVGKDAVNNGYNEDGGFAINGGKGWADVVFTNHQIVLNGPMAIAMGSYDCTCATSGEVSKVEYTFGYKRNADGKARIFLHHSSVPYRS